MRSTVPVRPSSLPRRLPVLILALVAVTASCREDTGLPTGPEADPVHAVAAAEALGFRRVSAGSQHACGLTTGRRAWCWGSNAWGQLGDGTRTNRAAPVAVAGGLRFDLVSAGWQLSCGAATGSRGYCWGEPNGPRPVPIPAPM
jgi:alpha-tubulin suppressor-like RCC1 family protein